MPTQNFCPQCGGKLASNSSFCNSCGRKLSSEGPSSKSALVALLLCIFFGSLGIHRFYVGKIGTGILMLITLGGFGIWTIVDTILIACGEFKDTQGNKLEFIHSSTSTPRKAAVIIASLLGALLVYIILIVMLVLYATNSLVITVNNQLSALRHGDFEKAYTYTSKDFQNTVSLNNFKKFVNNYPSLKNNESATFTSREFKNSEGFLEGTLQSRDGATTPVRYRLVKEDHKWKILALIVNPTGVGTEIDNATPTQANSSNNGMNLFVNKSSRYSIEYPRTWKYVEPEKGTVLFTSKIQQKNHLANVTIQTILSSKKGGHFNHIDEFVLDLKNQIVKLPDSKIIEEGDIELPKDPKNYSGRFMVVTYTYNNKSIKQMQFIIARKDGLLFYSWGYTAKANDYDTYLPLAKTMFESWVIY